LEYHWKDQDHAHQQQSNNQTLYKLEIKINSQSILLQIHVTATSWQGLVFFLTVIGVDDFFVIALSLKVLECFWKGSQLISWLNLGPSEASWGSSFLGFI
jgi:hypothetical protein